MTQPPNIDGILITWGDRLFYPGNRVVKVKLQPRSVARPPDSAQLQSASASRRRWCAVHRR
jgi:hypothetical protein